MSYDAVIVGAGMFGASLARTLTDRHKKVLVIEKRDHTGGMCHTEMIEGIVFHKYGPHVFHTNDFRIWNFVKRFGRWEPFIVRTKAIAKGRLWSFPVNLMTLHQLWGVKTPAEALERLKTETAGATLEDNLEDWILGTYGKEIYETFYKGYTKKQWGRDPRSLPSSIARRLPHRLTFEDNYFTDRYQAIPSHGYDWMFDKMLDGIEVRTNCDFHSDRKTFEKLGRVVYSGRIDEFFDYQFGDLEFRTCHFETTKHPGDYQGNAVINYCDQDIPWTRIVEHKHFSRKQNYYTLVTKEFPMECDRQGTPLYPINDVKNSELYKKYASIKTDAILAGRLGSYKYFDMGEVIAQAWKIADNL